MSSLPDELWNLILQIGISKKCLTYVDLCRISVSSHRLNRLSSENSLWNQLISSDFYPPLSPPSSHSSKAFYKSRVETIVSEQATFTVHQRKQYATFFNDQQQLQELFLKFLGYAHQEYQARQGRQGHFAIPLPPPPSPPQQQIIQEQQQMIQELQQQIEEARMAQGNACEGCSSAAGPSSAAIKQQPNAKKPKKDSYTTN